MKNLKILLSAFVLAFFAFSANAQSCCSGKKAEKGACCAKSDTKSSSASTVDADEAAVLVSNDVKTETKTFKVYGNCGMCKRRIEGALVEVEGVQSAEWDMESGKLTVNFDAEVITLDDIQKKVAAVGHDTKKYRAEDAVYNKLHGCCQYERAKA